MPRLLAFSLALVAACAAHAETCRFSGTTSHDGRLAARTEITESDDLVTVDATLEFTVSAWLSGVSPDHHLLRLGMDVGTTWATGRATLHADGCTGVQITPG